VQLVLVAALLPFFALAIDLYALCRRRRIPLAPALRSLRTRLAFWLILGGAFALLAWTGAWPGGASRPLQPASHAAGTWPLGGLAALAAVAGLGWIVARHRLVPRSTVTGEDELAGHAVTQVALAVLALLVVATNAFALLLLLPSLHVWPWLTQMRDRRLTARLGALVAGAAGLVLVVLLFATRYGLGFDAPWYLAELAVVGYVPWTSVVLFLAWLAIGAQLSALAFGRYAPYPAAAERPQYGPVREAVRFVVLTARARRTEREEQRRDTG
jgi:hypothetical protein